MRATGAVVLAALVGVVASVALVAATPAGAARRKPAVEFRPVLAQMPAASATTTTAPVDPAIAKAAKATVASCDVAAVQQLPVIPTTAAAAAVPTVCVVFPIRSGGQDAPRYYLGPAGDLPVEDAAAELQAGQGWTVKVEFTRAGAKAWDRLADAQFHQQVAVTYRGFVVAAPMIQPDAATFRSFDGVAVISGAFGKQEARALAAAARR